jgi:CHAT domain-containing protein
MGLAEKNIGMRSILIFGLLLCAMLTLISTFALAQTDDSLAEAERLSARCEEFYNAGKYDEAIEPCQRALEIREKALGDGHPLVTELLNNLGELYREKGDYASAEPLHRRALAIREKSLGAEHPDVAVSLNNLGLLYNSKGDYARAEPLYQRALAINEKALGSEHPSVARSLHNLASLYREKDQYAKAEPLFQRALAIREKALGGEHPIVAISLNGLAGLYQDEGNYAKAEPLFLRALAIREKTLGGEHPSVSVSLHNLAILNHYKGDYSKSELFYHRALAIKEKVLGTKHPSVATSLFGLAVLYEEKEDYPRAIEFRIRAEEILEANLSAILATGSEKQKQLYLDTLWGATMMSVSLHAHSAPSNMQALRLALTTILRRKGRALDAMTDQITGLRRRAAAEDVRLLDALAVAQSRLANLALSNITRLSPAERRALVTQLDTQIDELQNDISRRSEEFRARTQPVTLDAVRRAIPAGAALVEIFTYSQSNTKATPTEGNLGTERYIAYVLKSTDEPQFVDLGEAAAVDADIKLWRAALRDPTRKDVRVLGRKVDERVMRPIRNLFGDTKRVFISPDGALNLIPFAALVDENNKYLTETYSINYLTSGRDLLRLKVQSENRPGAHIFANPTYNLSGERIVACERKPARGLSAGTNDSPGKRATTYRGTDFTKACYEPLKGTAEEATRISAIIPGASVLTEKSATEAALKALNAPGIVHVATHGFFLSDQQHPAPQTRQFEREKTSGNSDGPTLETESPLLRSGLIMAGANQKSSGANEDGVLTAAEAAGLNLWGTRLVVLSACETGLGDVVNGEGVYGLRRALVLAGSETQVMSLWKVDDAATRDLMVDYYTRLQRGEERAEAMRQAQLVMLQSKTQNRAHPYYWAAFISSGDWRRMDAMKQ